MFVAVHKRRQLHSGGARICLHGANRRLADRAPRAPRRVVALRQDKPCGSPHRRGRIRCSATRAACWLLARKQSRRRRRASKSRLPFASEVLEDWATHVLPSMSRYRCFAAPGAKRAGRGVPQAPPRRSWRVAVSTPHPAIGMQPVEAGVARCCVVSNSFGPLPRQLPHLAADRPLPRSPSAGVASIGAGERRPGQCRHCLAGPLRQRRRRRSRSGRPVGSRSVCLSAARSAGGRIGKLRPRSGLATVSLSR